MPELTILKKRFVSSDDDYNDLESSELNLVSKTYSTSQTTPVDEDRATILYFDKISFDVGDVVEFDIDYVSGTLDHWIVFFPDGIDNKLNWFNRFSIGQTGMVDTLLEYQERVHGEEFGTYHVKATYTSEGADIVLTTPTHTIENYKVVGYKAPFNPALVLRVGIGATLDASFKNITVKKDALTYDM